MSLTRRGSSPPAAPVRLAARTAALRSIALISLGLATLCFAPRTQDGDSAPDSVGGRVVDARGKPVRKVEVAASWDFSEGEPRGYQSVTTGRDGSFSGLQIRRFPAMLLAYSANGKLAGSVVADAAGRDDLEIVLRRTVRVRGDFVSEKLEGRIPWTNAYIWSADRKHRMLMCASNEAKFDLLLPPGEYLLQGYGTDVNKVWKDLEIGERQRRVDLGDIEITATFLALMRGKKLPEWHVTAARNAVNDAPALADYRGKYLLIEAWGFW
jgi:hypothetical protein